MKILIAGDFVPHSRTLQSLLEQKYESIFGDIAQVVRECDYSILNLEAPVLLNDGYPIQKVGPNLKSPIDTVEAIQYAGFKGVTLANNHFYDYGEDGVSDTMDSLAKSNIDFVGAGRNIIQAGTTLFKRICEKEIAFINCCEHEYSIATESKGGSNPLNPIRIYKSIQNARIKAEYVIVIVHGGIEGYQLPTPRMQEVYRFFVDAGADAVINHHQHCYSGYEYYKGKPIFYGLGNFSFDWDGKRKSIWNEGFLLKLSIDANGINHELFPYIQGDEIPGVILMQGKKVDEFYSSIFKFNEIISDPKRVQEEHEKYMDQTERSQCYTFCPFTNKYIAALYVRGFLPALFPTSKLRGLQNKIMCESHRERILYYLSNKLK